MASGTTVTSGVWQGRTGPAIEYPVEVLEEIRSRAVNGLRAFARGGLEVGGVLYGIRESSQLIRVLRFAQVESDHARGPGFALSQKDHIAFAALLEAPEGLEPVGWFCSHTRRGLELGSPDLEIFDRYFTTPGSIALILKPAALGTARALFYARDLDGSIMAAGAGSELLLEPARKRIRPREPEREPEPERAQAAESPSAPEVEPEPDEHLQTALPPLRETLEQPEYTEPLAPESSPGESEEPEFAQPYARKPLPDLPPRPFPQFRRRRRFRAAFLWVALATAAAGGVFFLGRRSQFTEAPARPASSRDLGLSLQETQGGQVKIAWDRQSPWIELAHSGTLEIRDNGKSVRLPLSREDLQGSSATYEPQSMSVEVELRVEGSGGGMGQTASLTLSAAQQPPPGAPADAPRQTDTASRQEPEPATTAAPAPQRSMPKPSAPKGQPRVESAEKTLQIKPSRVFAPPPSAPKPVEQVQLTAPPPAIGQNPGGQQRLPAEAPGLVMTVPAPAPPAARPQPPAYSGPRSGRVLWTGALERRGVVEIEGSHASIGSLVGALPGVPVNIRVSPAEFSAEGLVVHTSDPARNGAREQPGSGNGWNRTAFQWDPGRAAQLVLLEQPNPANHYSRLALRNDARLCSVIVIDWSVR